MNRKYPAHCVCTAMGAVTTKMLSEIFLGPEIQCFTFYPVRGHWSMVLKLSSQEEEVFLSGRVG